MMIEHQGDNGVRCRLVRRDGTEWVVTGLYHVGTDIEVDAVHYGIPSTVEGEPTDGAPNLRRLVGEPLDRGDLLQWFEVEGDVVWSMKVPVDQPLA